MIPYGTRVPTAVKLLCKSLNLLPLLHYSLYFVAMCVKIGRNVPN